MARFSSALDRAAETIKRPPPAPMGWYRARVTKVPDAPREIEGKPYEILSIPLALVEAHEVDDADLAAFGKVEGTPTRIDFVFNTDPNEEQKFESTLNRLKNFCTQLGIDTTEGTPKMWLAQMPNAQLLVEIKHRMDPNDETQVYAEVGRTAAL